MFPKLVGFELKRLFKAVPIRVAVAFNCVVLIIFIWSNSVPLERSLAEASEEFHSRYLAFSLALDPFLPFLQFVRALDDLEEFLNEMSVDERNSFEPFLAHLNYLYTVRQISRNLSDLLAERDQYAAFYEYHNFIDLRYEHEQLRRAHYQSLLNFTSYLLDNEIIHINQHDMTPLNFLYQVFARLLPFCLFFIIAIVCFHNIAKDIERGTLTFSMAQPVTKIKLLLSKYTAVVLASLAVLLVPLFVTAVVLGFVNGFDNPRYPVLIQTNTYTTLTPLPNNIRTFERISGRTIPENLSAFSVADRLGISRFNVLNDFDHLTLDFSPNEGLSFVPIYIFLLLTLPLWITGVLLFTGFVFFLGLLLKRRLLSFSVSLLAAGGSLFYTTPVTNLDIFARLNPFLSIHAGAILGGIGSTTSLWALLVNVFGAMLLLLSCCVMIKRLEMR